MTKLLQLRVTAIEPLTAFVTAFRLRAADGAPLPGWQAGAHIRLNLPLSGGPVQRAYSLIDFDPAGDVAANVSEYCIAVRRDDAGRGGSLHMHRAIRVGDVLSVEPPRNDFPLDTSMDDSVLLAGGIGVTPLISMAAALLRAGRRFTFHYSARSADQRAYDAELVALLGDRLQRHADDDAATALNIADLLGRYRPGQPLYVCGPKGMIDAVLAEATRRGWAREQVHFELFSEATAAAGDHAFELVLAKTGQTLTVAADKTVLETLIEAGLDPLFDCQRGECGVCACDVLEGEVDHRDYCLSAAEKAQGKVMQTCVSRARGTRLVIDL